MTKSNSNNIIISDQVLDVHSLAPLIDQKVGSTTVTSCECSSIWRWIRKGNFGSLYYVACHKVWSAKQHQLELNYYCGGTCTIIISIHKPIPSFKNAWGWENLVFTWDCWVVSNISKRPFSCEVLHICHTFIPDHYLFSARNVNKLQLWVGPGEAVSGYISPCSIN